MNEIVTKIFAKIANSNEPLYLLPGAELVPVNNSGFLTEDAEVSGEFISVVPIYGVITKGTGLEKEDCLENGICDLDHLANDLRAVEHNNNAQMLLLHVRSPGGETIGLPEVARQIQRIAQRIPVIAYSDTYMCSAAYYLASQATFVYAAESAVVGSVGTIVMRQSNAKLLTNNGIEVLSIASSDAKKFGVEELPITEAEIAYLQNRIDTATAEFKSVVQNKRNISDTDLNGYPYRGIEAVQKGYINGIYDDLNMLVAELFWPINSSLSAN